MTEWHDWIGREETAHDRLTPAMLARWHATLDLVGADAAVVPPLAHWLCFLPDAPQSAIDRDGHPRRGGFLPPVDLPRRMWAGGRLEFHAPPPLDVHLVRRSTILDVTAKSGASGRLVFVTVRHAVSADGVPIVTEEQDLVYREAPPPTAPRTAALPPVAADPADAERTLVADPVLLFRFSALTFNAHRIHYDRAYATEVEGYAGLVVHGPLLATLLLHHGLEATSGRRFAFRALRPVFDGAPFTLCRAAHEDGQRLWVRDAGGHTAMSATLD